MTPWPPDLLRDYPMQENRHPVRPWWTTWGHYWERRAGGLLITVQRHVDKATSLDDLRADNVRCLALMAAHDAQNPIEHPGYRAGQVWASVCPAITRIYTIALHEPKPLQLASTFLVHTRTSMRWWEAKPMNAEKLTALLSNDGNYPYFLLADTVCPWMAPWASRLQVAEEQA